MHPSDGMRIRLLKKADGEYLLGEPGAQLSPTLFGFPVVATTSMTVGKFLIGDFKVAATRYDRWTPRVEVSTDHADFVTRNLVAILAGPLRRSSRSQSSSETSAMSLSLQKVRTIRPHDTIDGLRSPGDKYDWPAAEAKQLAEQRVVSIVAPPKDKGSKGK